ncbi:MAG: DoxX family protein [Ktedonobacterales bacterium]
MNTIDVGLLVLRLVVGVTIGVHGTQKLFGWWGGPGLAKVRQGFAAQRYRPADLWVGLAILGEVGGAVSLIFGFLTPLGAAGVFGAMFMATFKSHWKNGFLLTKGGYEYSLLLMVVSLALGVMGPGRYSLDGLFGLALNQAPLFVALAVAALLVDLIGIYISRPVPAVPAEARSGAS